jgi:hypothetical protein
MEVDTDITNIAGDTVIHQVECRLADKNFDDPFSGYVTGLLIAEVA